MYPFGQRIAIQEQPDKEKHFTMERVVRENIARNEIKSLMLQEQLGDCQMIDQGVLARFRCQDQKECRRNTGGQKNSSEFFPK